MDARQISTKYRGYSLPFNLFTTALRWFNPFWNASAISPIRSKIGYHSNIPWCIQGVSRVSGHLPFWFGCFFKKYMCSKHIIFSSTWCFGSNKYLRECIKTPFWYKQYKNFLGRRHSPLPDLTLLAAFGAQPSVPLSDGLDTLPCKILDPRLNLPILKMCWRSFWGDWSPMGSLKI